MRRIAATPGERVAAAGAAAWLLCVAAIEVSRAVDGRPSVHDLAATPAGVAAGRAWQLLSSGLLVSGIPVIQLIGAAIVVAATIRLLGALGFCAAALVAHVGSALVVYAAVGVLWLLARPHAHGLIHREDFGISCVWLGALGALAGRALARRRVRRRLALLALGLPAVALVLVPTGRLAPPEHAAAWLLGAATFVALSRRRSGRLRQPLRA